MFRIDVYEENGKAKMKIAGRVGSQCAEEMRHQILCCRAPHQLLIDLSEVTFVDKTGEQALSWLGHIGAHFIAKGLYCVDVCERLHLRIVKCGRSRRRLLEAVS